jgi:hypothetical protein
LLISCRQAADFSGSIGMFFLHNRFIGISIPKLVAKPYYFIIGRDLREKMVSAPHVSTFSVTPLPRFLSDFIQTPAQKSFRLGAAGEAAQPCPAWKRSQRSSAPKLGPFLWVATNASRLALKSEIAYLSRMRRPAFDPAFRGAGPKSRPARVVS